MTPAPLTDDDHPRRVIAPIGHSGRLSLPPLARLLIAGQLLVMGLSLQDKEIAHAIAEAANFVGPRGVFAVEVAVSLTLLAAWAGLTLGWVRLACARRGGEKAE